MPASSSQRSLLALTVTACGSAAEQEGEVQPSDQIEVSGEFGEKPTIKIDSPLSVTEDDLVDHGRRARARRSAPRRPRSCHSPSPTRRTGKTAISTHDEGQRPLEVKLGDQVFPSLAKSLVGESAGSRVVVASTPDDAYGDQGRHADRHQGRRLDRDGRRHPRPPTRPSPRRPHGSRPRARRPPHRDRAVRRRRDRVRLHRARRKPKKSRRITLREGTGPAIESPDRIAADYLGAGLGRKKPFDSTYGKEPARFSIGLGGVIKAWDQGLAGAQGGGPRDADLPARRRRTARPASRASRPTPPWCSSSTSSASAEG